MTLRMELQRYYKQVRSYSPVTRERTFPRRNLRDLVTQIINAEEHARIFFSTEICARLINLPNLVLSVRTAIIEAHLEAITISDLISSYFLYYYMFLFHSYFTAVNSLLILLLTLCQITCSLIIPFCLVILIHFNYF